MKQTSVFFSVFSMLFVVQACSAAMLVFLFNNSGGEISLSWQGRVVTIPAGRPGELPCINCFETMSLRLSSGQCEYSYEVPMSISHYNKSPFIVDVRAQVEKDFSIDLLPVDYSGDGPAPADVILKREGFPLRPVSRVCR